MDVSALKESDGVHELLLLNAQEIGGFGAVGALMPDLMRLAKCGLRNFSSFLSGFPETVVF